MSLFSPTKGVALRASSTFFCVLLLYACAGGGTAPTPVAAVGQPSPVEFNQSSYRIGPGDVLEIFVWRNPEISKTVPVRPDGKISTPLVEDMVAVGKTPSDLARDMEAVLATFIKSPSVNVIVTSFQGTFDGQIRVVGQAANPQTIPYREGTTLLDVMIAVGGLGEFAAGNRAKLVRRFANGETAEYVIRLDSLLNKGNMEENLSMQPGDVVIIPESFF